MVPSGMYLPSTTDPPLGMTRGLKYGDASRRVSLITLFKNTSSVSVFSDSEQVVSGNASSSSFLRRWYDSGLDRRKYMAIVSVIAVLSEPDIAGELIVKFAKPIYSPPMMAISASVSRSFSQTPPSICGAIYESLIDLETKGTDEVRGEIPVTG